MLFASEKQAAQALLAFFKKTVFTLEKRNGRHVLSDSMLGNFIFYELETFKSVREIDLSYDKLNRYT